MKKTKTTLGENIVKQHRQVDVEKGKYLAAALYSNLIDSTLPRFIGINLAIDLIKGFS